MDDLPYQNETFLKLRESRFQIQAVYSAKKLPVLIFLIHVFFFVSITLFSILGIYYLIKSLLNQSKTNKVFYDKVKDWNLTDYKRFKNLNIEIYSPDNPNYSKRFEYKKEYLTNEDTYVKNYAPLIFEIDNLTEILLSLNDGKTIKDSDSQENENFTIDLNIKIENKTISLKNIDLSIKYETNITKENCQNSLGVYDYNKFICFKYYFLRKFCIVLNEDYSDLYSDYKYFKCNSFTSWYESFKEIKWKYPGINPNIYDITKEITTQIYIASSNDPYIWLSLNKNENNEDNTANINAIVFILISLVLIMVGICLYFREEKIKEAEYDPEGEPEGGFSRKQSDDIGDESKYFRKSTDNNNILENKLIEEKIRNNKIEMTDITQPS